MERQRRRRGKRRAKPTRDARGETSKQRGFDGIQTGKGPIRSFHRLHRRSSSHSLLVFVGFTRLRDGGGSFFLSASSPLLSLSRPRERAGLSRSRRCGLFSRVSHFRESNHSTSSELFASTLRRSRYRRLLL